MFDIQTQSSAFCSLNFSVNPSRGQHLALLMGSLISVSRFSKSELLDEDIGTINNALKTTAKGHHQELHALIGMAWES